MAVSSCTARTPAQTTTPLSMKRSKGALVRASRKLSKPTKTSGSQWNSGEKTSCDGLNAVKSIQ